MLCCLLGTCIELNLCSGKLGLWCRFIWPSIMARCFLVSFHRQLVCTALFSAQWDVQPGLNRDHSIDCRLRRKRDVACHAIQRYWVGLINTYWLFSTDRFLLVCSFLFVMPAVNCMYVFSFSFFPPCHCGDTVLLGSLCLYRNELGINE